MCLHDTQLIRLVAGELSSGERATCIAHIETCAHCRQRLEAQQQAWEMLGQWGVDLPPGGFTVDVNRPLGRIEPVLAGFPRHSWRMAAAVMLAAGAGVVAGLVVPSTSTSIAAAEVPHDQVVEQLGLDELAESSGALEALLAPVEASPEHEEAL